MWPKTAAFILILGLISCAPETDQDPDFTLAELQLEPEYYNLNFTVDYEAEQLKATCRLTLRNVTEDPVTIIPLILYRLLNVSEITDDSGRSLEFKQEVLSYTDWGKKQINFIQVFPPERLTPQGTVTINLVYAGYLLGYAETGALYMRDHISEAYTVLREECLAFPMVGVPNEQVNRARVLHRFHYRISTDVPDHLVVANGGRLENIDRQKGRAVYTYTSLKPSWRMDVAIADYQIIKDEVRKLRAYFFKQDAEKGEMVLGKIQDTIDLLSTWFGPLEDFLGFSVIEVPEGYGSQADATCILQTADTFSDPNRLTGLYHEISHLWNPAHLDPLPSRLESEGLAMLLQYLIQEKLDSRAGAVESGFNRLRGRARQAFARNPSAGDVPIFAYGQEDLTDLSYSKGMLFFTLLYRLMGEEEFLNTVGSYQARYRESGATTEEFIRYFQKNSSVSLELLFEEWLTGPESSRYIVEEWPLEEMLARYRR